MTEADEAATTVERALANLRDQVEQGQPHGVVDMYERAAWGAGATVADTEAVIVGARAFAEDVSRGFDRGNCASAYETEDYEAAIAALDESASEDYRAAFTLGFFGTYEPHEMGAHEEDYWQAYCSRAGRQCLAAGYVDERTEKEP